MHRIVHLDLKGAPLNVSYLEKVIILSKSWGATGILIEWEDTFPFLSELVDIGSVGNAGGDGLYSVHEVRYILQFIKDNGLEAIQLVQTIGHMEYVLKHPMFWGVREESRSPAVLCPSKEESQALVCAMIDQVLELQPDAAYLHIGADEVWHIGVCPDCKMRAATNEHKTASLYLEHIRNIVLHIKKKRPNLTVLMWEDMLRSISLDALRLYHLGDLIQPVLWHYNPMECFQIDPNLWDTYRQIFPQVWGASAYKGANGSCQTLSPVIRYVSNHRAWQLEIKKNAHNVNFGGIILTGWSRFDHYATMCELMPVSLPSLASCLRVLVNVDDAPVAVSEVLPSDEWPGEELARCVHSLLVLKDKCLAFIHGDVITTWLNPWQLERSYTNPTQVEGVAVTAQHLQTEMTTLQREITRHLHATTGRRSTEEWVATFIAPLLRKITKIREIAHERTLARAGVTPSFSKIVATKSVTFCKNI